MADSADSTPRPRGNPLQRLAGVLLSPVETLRDIAARPTWVVPLLLITLLGAGSSALVAPKVDVEATIREQMGDREIPPQQWEMSLKMGEFMNRWSPAIALVTTPLILLVVAGLYLLAFKVFGGEGTFRQYFSVTAHAWIPQVVSGILLTIVLLTRDRIVASDVQTALMSNLGFLVEPKDAPLPFALLSSLDVFSIWTLVLMVLGYGMVSRLSRGMTIALVLAPWLLYLIGKMAMASLAGAAA
jgi:hypothetical protein